LKRINCILVLLLILSWSLAPAQINTESPYSRYGLGELSGKGFEKSRAMGGIGLGLRDNNHINYLNPASYTAQDTLSFLFNFGLKSAFTTYETSNSSNSARNLRMDHLAIGFPITKWWKTSFGVLPFSSVGYSVIESKYLENNDAVDYMFKGNGGINQLYLGTSFNVFRGLSVGANFTYLFGSLDLLKQIQFPLNTDYAITTVENNIIIHDFIYHFGLQYHHSFAEQYTLTVGAIYDLKTNINAENQINKSNLFSGTTYQLNDTLLLQTELTIEQDRSDGNIVFPYKIGAGCVFNYNNRIAIGFDYYKQDWTNALFFNQEEPLTTSNSAHLGLEITPDPRAMRGYYNRIHYRAGGHYENLYLEINGEQLKDYGISFGVGLPLRTSKSSFNVACEIGQKGTLESNLIRENYVFLSFNVTLHDFWFLKRKYD
jgi:hypothetical protein